VVLLTMATFSFVPRTSSSVPLACCKVGLDRPLIPSAFVANLFRSRSRKGVRNEWHSVKLNTLGFKVLRRKTPAHRLIMNNMISISLDLKPRVSEAYYIFYILICFE